MIYNEMEFDLFFVPPNYDLVQCISHDLKMNGEIAERFVKYGAQKNTFLLRDMCKGDPRLSDDDFCNVFKKGYCVKTHVRRTIEDECYKWYLYNLVTKNRCYEKTTYDALTQALNDMKELINGNKKIAMPRIGCGYDGLEWSKVSEIIKNVFADTDVEILVCIK